MAEQDAIPQQQDALHIGGILPDDAQRQRRRTYVLTGIGGGERAAGIDRVGNQRRNQPDQERDTERETAQEIDGFPARQEGDEEEHEIAGRQKQVRQAEIDRKAEQQAEQRGEPDPA